MGQSSYPQSQNSDPSAAMPPASQPAPGAAEPIPPVEGSEAQTVGPDMPEGPAPTSGTPEAPTPPEPAMDVPQPPSAEPAAGATGDSYMDNMLGGDNQEPAAPPTQPTEPTPGGDMPSPQQDITPPASTVPSPNIPDSLGQEPQTPSEAEPTPSFFEADQKGPNRI